MASPCLETAARREPHTMILTRGRSLAPPEKRLRSGWRYSFVRDNGVRDVDSFEGWRIPTSGNTGQKWGTQKHSSELCRFPALT